MMVVLEIAMIAPANTLSSTVQPKARPRPKPRNTITLLWSTAMIPAVGATRNSFRRLNSRPSANISRMTPSSARVCTSPSSATRGTGMCGPMIIPASR